MQSLSTITHTPYGIHVCTPSNDAFISGAKVKRLKSFVFYLFSVSYCIQVLIDAKLKSIKIIMCKCNMYVPIEIHI